MPSRMSYIYLQVFPSFLSTQSQDYTVLFDRENVSLYQLRNRCLRLRRVWVRKHLFCVNFNFTDFWSRGGTSGCVVAARLAEDPDVTVAVIEAGPDSKDLENVHMPGGYVPTKLAII